ncbi:nuclear protein Es2-domain-containing protein [Phlyctochytrium arcticum]|nr:nuclear protein Es2-domain-containing protein [Phlyctochytrium arcticum]
MTQTPSTSTTEPLLQPESLRALATRQQSTSLITASDAYITAKRPRWNPEVLEEDDYVEAVSDIIERDFFPTLKKLRLQSDFLDAVQEDDYFRARQVGGELRQLQSKRKSTAAGAETPEKATPRVTGITPLIKEAGWRDDLVTGTPQSIRSVAEGGADMEISPSKEKLSTNMSLDVFQHKYTSEDNASFSKILDKSNDDRQKRYNWILDKESKQLKLELGPAAGAMNLIEEGEARDRMPKPVETWKYEAVNSLMYVPDGAALTLAEEANAVGARGDPKSITHSATRFDAKVVSRKILVSGQTQDRLRTTQVWRDMAKDTPGLLPATEARTPSRSDEYLFVPSTPVIRPDEDVDPSDLMTWGVIEGTPLLVDVGEGRGNGGRGFSMPETPHREVIGKMLSEKASKSLRKKATYAPPSSDNKITTPGLGNVTPREWANTPGNHTPASASQRTPPDSAKKSKLSRAGFTPTQQRIATLSPAARQLLGSRSKIQLAPNSPQRASFGSSLRNSYAPSEGRGRRRV